MKYRIILGLLLIVALAGLSPFTLQGFQITVSLPVVNPVISINGSTAPAQVITATTLVAAGSGGPGNQSDWLHICRTSTGTCTGYDYTYLNCTKTQPSSPPFPTGTPTNGCTLQTPTSNDNYYVLWETSSTHVEVARLTFSVNLTGGPSITALTVAPNTIVPGQSFSGTLSTTCSVTCPNPASYQLVTDAMACSTNNNNLFSISGATLSSIGPMNTAGNYFACVAVTMVGVSTSPVDFPVQVTVQTFSIASVSATPHNFTIPPGNTTASFSGTLSATCNPSPCPTAASFTLTSAGPSIVINGPTAVNPGATVSVTAAGGPGLNKDSILLCLNSTTCGAGTTVDYSDWDYLDCTKTSSSLTLTGGTCNLTAFVTPGNYYADFVPAAGTPVYASTPFTVKSTAGPSITINGPTTVAPGATVSVTVAGGPGQNGDQIALCQQYTQCGVVVDFSDWDYLDCTKTSSTLTATGGTCNLIAFNTPGKYYADFIPAAGTSVYASTPFTVAAATTCTAPCVLVNGAASGTSVAAGATISVHAEDNSNATDAYMQQCTGTTIGTCSGSNWAYMNCTQTQPSLPVAANTCQFTAPSTANTYYYGLINKNGLAAEASFVVTGGTIGGVGCQDADMASTVIPSLITAGWACDTTMSVDFDRLPFGNGFGGIPTSKFYAAFAGPSQAGCTTNIDQANSNKIDSLGFHIIMRGDGTNIFYGSGLAQGSGGFGNAPFLPANYFVDYKIAWPVATTNAGFPNNAGIEVWTWGPTTQSVTGSGYTGGTTEEDDDDGGTNNFFIWAPTSAGPNWWQINIWPKFIYATSLWAGQSNSATHTWQRLRQNGNYSWFVDTVRNPGNDAYGSPYPSPHPAFVDSHDQYQIWTNTMVNCGYNGIASDMAIQYIHFYHP